MPLNEVKPGSNMYGWINSTWNPIRGRCDHQCSYCYMLEMPISKEPLRIESKELGINLRSGQTIFVGSSTDMWAGGVPAAWIEDTLASCNRFNNKYLFQSKNPARFLEGWNFPKNTILGTTIETNRDIPDITKAPMPAERFVWIKAVARDLNFPVMLSLEPILDYDLDILVRWVKMIAPIFVSIGADSKNHNLSEPSTENIRALIQYLKPITEVKIKSNLSRLMRQEKP